MKKYIKMSILDAVRSLVARVENRRGVFLGRCQRVLSGLRVGRIAGGLAHLIALGDVILGFFESGLFSGGLAEFRTHLRSACASAQTCGERDLICRFARDTDFHQPLNRGFLGRAECA